MRAAILQALKVGGPRARVTALYIGDIEVLSSLIFEPNFVRSLTFEVMSDNNQSVKFFYLIGRLCFESLFQFCDLFLITNLYIIHFSIYNLSCMLKMLTVTNHLLDVKNRKNSVQKPLFYKNVRRGYQVLKSPKNLFFLNTL